MSTHQLRDAARLATLLVERRKADPLYNWEPYTAQRRYLESTSRETWFLGANRSGKTDVLAAAVASLARYGHLDPKPCYMQGGNLVLYDKAVSIWCVSLTFEMSRDIFAPKLFNNGYVPPGQPHEPFIPGYEVHGWSQTAQVLTLRNGGLVGFKSADQGRERFQGTGKDLVAFDEAPPFSVYTECVIRVEAGRPLYVRGACTLLPPDGVTGGISWLFPERVAKWKAGQRDLGFELIGASIYDNPHIPREEIERLEGIYPPGSMDRRIRLDGEWLPQMAGSLAYGSFNRAIHINPKLTRDSLEWRLPLFLCFDSNVAPCPAVIVQRIGRMYRVIDEICLESGSIADLANEFRKRYNSHGAELVIYGDATSQRRNAQTAKSDYELLLNELRGLPYPIRLCLPEKNPAVRDRINAVNSLLRGTNGEVRVEIAPHCTELIDDLEQVQRDKFGGIKKVHDRHDPYYRRTHWSDALGYMAVFREPVLATNRAERPLWRSSVGIPQASYNMG